MAEQQSMLDRWFLQQEVIDQLLGQGEEREDAVEFGQRIATIAATEEAEHQSLHDPFDRSVALVLSLVREEEFNPWDVDLSAFLNVFAKRVKEGENLDLPACGRLIRLSWEVLHHQSAVLFAKSSRLKRRSGKMTGPLDGRAITMTKPSFSPSPFWMVRQMMFCQPCLMNASVRTKADRVTLAELLSAFKDAADDAEALKQREINRLEHEKELSEYLDNVGGRMHNEDLEGDIERCWVALKSTCAEAGSATVPLVDVIANSSPYSKSLLATPLKTHKVKPLSLRSSPVYS